MPFDPLSIALGGLCTIAIARAGRSSNQVAPSSWIEPIESDEFTTRLAAELTRSAALGRHTAVIAMLAETANTGLSQQLSGAVHAGELLSVQAEGSLVMICVPDLHDARAAYERTRQLLDRVGERVRVGVSLDDELQTAQDMMHAAAQACDHVQVSGIHLHSSKDWPARPAAGRPMRPPQDAKLHTVMLLAQALDFRDADTSEHSHMVSWYAQLMGKQLGMSPYEIEQLRIAGLLHDVGKIGIPDSVLRKPAKLTDEEFTKMQEHPEIGARVLAATNDELITSWVIAHHERVDGRGYPHRLDADQIPLGARILSVADAYEAMTADRVYRSAPGPEFARRELMKCAGSQFDELVVSAFLSVLASLDAPAETAFQMEQVAA